MGDISQLGSLLESLVLALLEQTVSNHADRLPLPPSSWLISTRAALKLKAPA